jgi:putative ABC transport system permease protein
VTAAGSSLRLAARLARREVRRRPGRTALVALLVAVPVAGMVVAAAFVRTQHMTEAESWRTQWRAADAVLHTTTDPEIDVALPAGSRVVEYRFEYRVLRADDGRRSRAEVSDLPVSETLAGGVLQVTSGRAPARAGEAFLSRAVARRLGVGVGDELRLVRPAPASWRVTGVGERAAWWGSDTVVLGPGTAFPWATDPRLGTSLVRLVDLPPSVTASQLDALAASPAGVQLAPHLRSVECPGCGGTAGDEAVRWSWVLGAVVLTVVGIVIASAFAAGARRQLTTLGQLSANGAPPRVLRQVLFLQGTWTGVIGAMAGLALGAILLVALAPHADRLVSRDVDPWRVRLGDLAPMVVLGVVAASVAALVPARSSSRVPVLTALAGRRPLGRVPGWLPATGAIAGACGLGLLGLAVLGANGETGDGEVWVLTAIVGGIAVLLGACAVAPAYVSFLEPLAARLRGASRLAARSLARQRTRTGAVVSAVCATAALAIGASALVLSAEAKSAQEPDFMRDDEVHLQASLGGLVSPAGVGGPTQVAPALVSAVHAALPGAARHDIPLAVAENPTWRWALGRFTAGGPLADEGYVFLHPSLPGVAAAVAGPEVFEVYGLSERERDVIAEEGILGLGATAGRAQLDIVSEPAAAEHLVLPSPGAAPQVVVPGIAVAVAGLGDRAPGMLPRLIVTPQRARELGLRETAGPVVLRLDRPLTQDQRNAVADIVEEYHAELMEQQALGGGAFVDVAWQQPPGGVDPLVLEAILSGVALLFSLFVVATSLALAAAETRDERDVLAVVGAPPSAMSRTSGRKALLLTALGAVLAIPVGFLPVSVFTAASEQDLPLVFPWRIVLALVVAVPFVSAAVATGASAVALRLRPVRVSTMAFD